MSAEDDIEHAKRYLTIRGVAEETFLAHGGEIDALIDGTKIAKRLNRDYHRTMHDMPGAASAQFCGSRFMALMAKTRTQVGSPDHCQTTVGRSLFARMAVMVFLGFHRKLTRPAKTSSSR